MATGYYLHLLSDHPDFVYPVIILRQILLLAKSLDTGRWSLYLSSTDADGTAHTVRISSENRSQRTALTLTDCIRVSTN